MINDTGGVPLIIGILAILAIPWKIYAVWTAVKNHNKKWFVALILLNTFAILEIIYIFYIAKKNWTDIKKDVLHQYHEIRGKKKEQV